ncbi:hypothetical protein DFJ74DRAFT_422156 [Hyaloraphidium curvatum]|nr:hypothetical protein DFJ74DRAFT_422156 [Hyaloraphidium curvatum]
MLTVFDLLDMPPAPSNIGTLLSGIAGAGNYTGFLHALHGAASRYPDISTNLPLVRTFLGAVRNVARRACEDLEGYHVGPPLARGYSFAADLVVPVDPANRKDGRVSRDSPFAKIPSGPDLHVGRAADPVAALRRMAAHLAPADFLDLCRPDVPPGSVKPGNKVVALLGHALNLHAAGSAELDARVLTAVVEALVAWQQPATAVAAYDLLVGEPYGIQPEETAFIAMLEDCTKRDDEKLGNGVVARWRRDAQGRETRRPLYNALIAFYARTGRPELAREAYGELRAAGHEPNSVTLMALLDAVPPEPQGFAPFRALFDELGTAGVEISTQHWTKALSIMVKRGDRDGMAELLVAIPELDRTAIGVLATDAAERADVEDFKAALRLAPGPEELSHYPTWVAAIRCFRNAMIYVPELREAVVAVAAAVLDEEPLRAEDLPEQLQDVALVGVRPPTSDVAGVFRSALLATVADVLRKVGGVESDLLREKARQCLLRRGLDVPADNVQELCNALLGRTGTGSVVGGPVAKGRPLPS